jgi:hypothetical protein
MPDVYRGIVSAIVSYPGMLIASIDAGDSGYSTVNAWNGNGWCNLFTAPKIGMRIQNIYVQSIPGDSVDRLWISCADTTLWIPLSANPAEHPLLTYNGYKQAWDAKLEMARMYAGKRLVNKYWNNVKWYLTNRSYGFSSVFNPNYAYRVIFEDDGINPSGAFGGYSYEWDSEDYDELWTVPIGDTACVIMPKATIEMDDPTLYMTMESILFEVLSVDKIRRYDTLTVRVADRDKDLMGDFDDYLTASDKLLKLTTWEQTPTALTMTSNIGVMDTKTVFIVQGGIRLLRISQDNMDTEYIMQIQVYET